MTDQRAMTPQVLVGCNHCGLLFRTPVRHIGAQAPCPSCGQFLRITAGMRILAPAAVTSSPVPTASPALDPTVANLPLATLTPPSAAKAAASVAAMPSEPSASGPPPPLPASGAPPVIPPPVIPQATLATEPVDRSTWGCLLTGLAGFTLFAGGMLILVAAIVAVIPPPTEEWKQQKWSGVVCSLLAATTFILPGAWLWRQALKVRGTKREAEAVKATVST